MTGTLQASSGAPYARILGVGGYRPRRVVDNAEICTMIDSTDEWIRTRSGIVERRWAAPDETVAMMAGEAARKAIQRSGVEAGQIDCVIVSTVSHLHQTPAVAPLIAYDVGAASAAAFDISAACAGFCYATAMADAMIRSGAATYVLAIGVERLSDLTDRSDRGTAFIFADGAGAAVIGPSDVPAIGPVVWGSDGEKAPTIYQTQGWDEVVGPHGEAREGEPRFPTLRMAGRDVFKWASYTVAEKAREALQRSGIAPEELDAFIPHQANDRITTAMTRTLGLPDDVVVGRDIVHQGNTSAASIPLAIEALYEEGAVRSGQTALIIGFGAGLVYAGQVVVLP
ncbi:beta-ketoacyl-ACP synthase III [Auraticoccus sp. F435]|uniref:Beta-ketoacyl-[acyl-carrier-protein] synthase III n=1 Tax=Auraticoccus cholistanensis TaxID=2656650 RepID=A0A6A9UXK3_9ACTN|nr:beta-ketoacyl-ACP synthase III [Auraticoccus cholistanensis]